MTKPRVVRIVSYLNVGGVEKRLLALLKHLKKDFDVEVVCIHSRGKLAEAFEQAGIPVHVIPFKSRLHPISLYQLAAYLRNQMVDIVHTHMYRPNVSGTIAAKLAGVPVIISNVHNVDHWDNRRQMWTDRGLSQWRNKILTVSESVKMDYINKVKVEPNKVGVIYNGIEIEEFCRDFDKKGMREKLGIYSSQKVITCIARLVPQKGHRFLLESYREVEKRHYNSLLIIVGGGPLREELEGYSRALGLRRVCFLGERSDVPEILSITDVLVLPSLREGFSNVILESMAAKVPIVATDVGGAQEAITNGREGFIISYKDVKALRDRLLSLLLSDKVRSKTGKRGREKVRRCFSMVEMAEETAALYRSLLLEKRR